MVSASNDGTLCVWDILQQKLMAVQECASMPFKVPIVFSRDSSIIGVGTPENAVTFFNVESVVSNYNPNETRFVLKSVKVHFCTYFADNCYF